MGIWDTIAIYRSDVRSPVTVAASLAVFQVPCFPSTVLIANLLSLCITLLQLFTHMLVNQAVMWQ